MYLFVCPRKWAFVGSVAFALLLTACGGGGDSAAPVATTTPASSNTFAVPNFGSKTSASYFEDFEDKVLSGSTVGQINLSWATGQSVSVARAVSGSKSLQNDYWVNDFPKNYLKLSGAKSRFYFSCHLHYTGNPAGSNIWKQGRIGAGNVYGGTPRAGESWTSNPIPNGTAGEIVNSNGITSYWAQNTAAAGAEAIYGLNRWMFYEFEFYAGTVNNSDSYTKVTVDGVTVLLWNNRPFLTTATPDLPTWFLTPMNGLDGSPHITVNMDNVYSDESRARVIFTNNASYASSTKFNTQPITSYTNTQVTTKRSTPSFSASDTVHVHMWKEDGAYYYAGTKVLE